MKHIKSLGIIALFALAAAALAQSDGLSVSGTKPAASVTVTLTDASGVSLGTGNTAYSLGALKTDAFTYGADFLVQVTYDNVASSVSLAISGSQTNYTLAYRHLTPNATGGAYTNDVAFGTIGSASVSGSSGATFATGSTTTAFNAFNADNLNGTKFGIGAKGSTAASVDLATVVTITATAN